MESWEYIGFDGGFKGVQQLHPVFLPIEENGKGPLTEQEKQFNNKFSSYRTVMENVFAHIKHWTICKNTFRTKTSLEATLELHHKI